MSKIETQLAWVDTETSGLEHDRDRIIEIAIVVTDGDLNELETFEQKIRLSPNDRLAAAPKALEINGYNDTDWADAPLPNADIWGRVQQLTHKRILAGQNVTQFDAKFIAAEMLRFSIRPTWDRRMADTMGDAVRIMYALGVRHPKGYPTAGLEFVYDALGGPSMPAHRAMADVRRAMYVYKYFNDAFLFALKEPQLATREGADPVRQVSALSPRRPVERSPELAALQAQPMGYDANGSPSHEPSDVGKPYDQVTDPNWGRSPRAG